MTTQAPSKDPFSEIKSDRSRLENKIDGLMREFILKYNMHPSQLEISWGELRVAYQGQAHAVQGQYGSFIKVFV